MKRFIETKFFQAIRNASPLVLNDLVLNMEYDEFVKFLFSESNAFVNKTEYRNSLVYTLTELQNLRRVSGKKIPLPVLRKLSFLSKIRSTR